MIGFWFIISGMTIAALAIILLPLLGVLKRKPETLLQSQISYYREQLQLLTDQQERDEISAEDYQQSRNQLTQLLLDETAGAAELPDSMLVQRSYLTGLLLIILFPIIALLFYWQWGNYSLYSQWKSSQQQAALVKQTLAHLGTTENIIAALQEKLRQDPQSARGWYLLGKLYMSQQQFKNAAVALANANHLQPQQVEIMQTYAESLFFSENEKLSSQAKTLLSNVLAQNPNNIQALNLLALGAYRAGDFQTAIKQWEKLVSYFPEGSNDQQSLLMMIAAAEKHIQTQTAYIPIKLVVQVSIAKNVGAKFSTQDSLFVYAQAVNGPAVPVAVKRVAADHFPLTVTLTAANAMIPSISLINFQHVRIMARISKTGNAMAQKGDLQGESVIINVNKIKHPIIINIDHQLS